MNLDVIQERLLTYNCQTGEEQNNALKEIIQEIALMALSRTDFFDVASFQGGTCLRIVHGLERFSEDLDFILDQPAPHFEWQPYVRHLQQEFEIYGFKLEIKTRENNDNPVRTAFLKADSQGGTLILRDLKTEQKILKIKLEIDANPSQGSESEIRYLDFPFPFPIKVQQLSCLFASKCHALLCRKYNKGRDWYDFLWYISRKTSIHFYFLEEAFLQSGPWKNQKKDNFPSWFFMEIRKKINAVDWHEAKKDVVRFLKEKDRRQLDAWSRDFFLSRIEKLESSYRVC